MSDPITPAAANSTNPISAATGKPDPTPMKIIPTPMRTDPVASQDNGGVIAGLMIAGGLLIALIGAGSMHPTTSRYEAGTASFGASMSQFGVLLAILGLHALAVRSSRA